MPTYLSPDSDITINDDGNMGFGTGDIEAWHSSFRAIQLAALCAIAWSATTEEIMMVSNAYASGATEWRYRTTGYARRVLIDNSGILFQQADFGTQDDVLTWVTNLSTKLDGTVNIGDWHTSGRLSMQPNVAAQGITVGGMLKVGIDPVGNVGTGEDTLASKSILAGTLLEVGQSIIFEAFGTTANNANVKTLRVNFGTSGNKQVMSRTLTPSVAFNWHIRGTIYLTTTTTQKAVTVIHDGAASEVDIVTNLDQNLAAAVLLAVTGEATANDDIVLQGFKFSWADQNT